MRITRYFIIKGGHYNGTVRVMGRGDHYGARPRSVCDMSDKNYECSPVKFLHHGISSISSMD